MTLKRINGTPNFAFDGNRERSYDLGYPKISLTYLKGEEVKKDAKKAKTKKPAKATKAKAKTAKKLSKEDLRQMRGGKPWIPVHRY